MLLHFSASSLPCALLRFSSSSSSSSSSIRRRCSQTLVSLLPFLPRPVSRPPTAIGLRLGSSVPMESTAAGSPAAAGTAGEDRARSKLEELNWDHSFVRELPGDARSDTIPREVIHACYTKVSPSAEVENPQLVVWSDSVAKLLDLDPQEFGRPDFSLLFSGALPLVGGLPYAQCYGGHQFGVYGPVSLVMDEL